MHQQDEENKTEKRESLPESGKIHLIEWQSTSKREGKYV